MRVLIFGLGVLGGGYAAATYFLDRGDEVRITDLRSEKELGEPLQLLKKRGASVICQEHREEDFRWADLVVKNPAIPVDSPYLGLAKEIVSDISYLFSSPLIEGIKLVAVTGTKGKTTTVAAVTHALNRIKGEALQLGNMGVSGFTILDILEKREKRGDSKPLYLVCELSSWQIRDLFNASHQNLPPFKIILLTSLFPDHLNKYGDYQAYKEDKWLLFNNAPTRIIIPAELSNEIVSANLGNVRTIESFSGVANFPPRLQPAWALCRSLGLGPRQTESAFESFRGVPHRQEAIDMKGGILFINDSAATIPQAVTFTCSNSPYQYHLICGGTDKNLAPDAMLEPMKRALSLHLLAGSFTTNKLIPLLNKQALAYEGPFNTMAAAVASAYKASRGGAKGTAVILSPGAASFDLFKHEFDRGEQFKEAVKNLE
ncbi:MAG: Mur ligase family protein [Sphaerochaetaceae bacterium]